MASRMKEDEKNERIIRGLLKQQENRRCINCNSLGPQYVCTNFWTFVCTNCSGIHREFTHRVKSVSMAKFTSQEVGALQEGGNQRAKEIYFKEWDPQRNSFPDGSNVERLRDFIKHVYVDRRYSGERSSDKPPRGKMGDKEEFYENRRTDGYQGGSRSPPYEDTYERRYNERSSPGARNDDRNPRYGYDERRSPGYDQESRQYGDYRKSPARPEVINDWRREDRFGNGRKPEDRRISDGDPKPEGRSPERPKDTGSSSPPVVRPVREILGENAIPLRIIEPPKANGNRTADGPQTQRTASSSSLGSTIGNPHEVKLENTGSLIDFDADPEPPVIAPVTQVQQTTVTQTVVQPTSSTNDNNWASFDFSPQTKVPQAPSNLNTLDSVFSQLSVPASVPAGGSSVGGGQIPAPVANNMNLASVGGNPNVPFPGQIPFGAGAPAAVPVSNFATMPPTGALAAASGITPIMPGSTGSALIGVNNAGQWPNVQHQQNSLFSGAGGQSTAQQFVPSVGVSNNQQWNFAPSHSLQGPSSTATAQIPQAVSQSVQDSASTGAPQPLPTETKISGRKELPADLFTATYATYPAAAAGWQTGPPRGMGFTMQYNTVVPMSSFPQSSRSMNPFDLGGETTPVQNQTFPSVASLQSALPNMPPPSGLLRTSSLGTPSSAWLPQQSLPYASVMPSQSLPYPSAVPQRAYVGAQLPSNLPPSSHQIGGIRSEASFGFVNTDQQMSGRFSAPTTPQPFSSAGGNPFG